jgi:ABC-2 type transport system permease protein
LIRVEFAKQWRRPRTLVTLAALALFSVVVTLALEATGPGSVQRVGDVPLFIVPRTSGFSIPVIALSSTMKFFLPLAVAVFAGESVAGEAGWGSLRYALARPVSRTRYLFSKLAVAFVLSLVGVVVLPTAALAVGTAAFGWHPFVAVDGAAAATAQTVTESLTPSAAVAKLAVSTLYVGAGMASIFGFAFLLSTVTSRTFVAVAGGVGLTVLSRVLNSDYLPGVGVVNTYMPNNDIDLWQHLFEQPAQTGGMGRFLLLQAVYFVVFLGLAWWWFVRRDVLL